MRRPSFPTVISLIALFVALGGTSYAVIKLPANSVGARQLKSNSVSGSKIRNGSVGSRDLAPSARGQRGPRGPEGPAGPAGPAGGASATPGVTVEPWHALALKPGWTNYGGTFLEAAYRKDSLGRVYLRGLVTKDGLPALDEVIAKLPVGYHPTARGLFAVGAGSPPGPGRVDVTVDGDVVFVNGATAETDFTSLDTIGFWTD
ncbi:MAG: hypothetical protein QOE11_1703 [Solirubrobacteraceae bacterium]|jgi:hypothetical protein|nr:hypothetical protein [Solirubrobacteraceae bacterium]